MKPISSRHCFVYLFSPTTRIACLLLFATLLALCLQVKVPDALADGGSASFGIQPAHPNPAIATSKSYFVFNSEKGASLQDSVRVVNNGTATGTVKLYTVDATTGQNSGIVYQSHTAPRQDIGAWITLTEQQVTLAPGQSQLVPFSIAVPTNARPGQHIGGIVAENDTQNTAQQNSIIHITLQSLTILAVQINIAGPQTEQLALTNVQAGGANGYQNILLHLSNTGTTLLKAHGTLVITDEQGHKLQQSALQIDTMLPATSIDYPVYMQNHPLSAGTYLLALNMLYGHQHILQVSQPFTVSSQQVAQVFKAQGPLQLSSSSLTSWQFALFGLFLVLVLASMFFGVYTMGRRCLVAISPKAHKQK